MDLSVLLDLNLLAEEVAAYRRLVGLGDLLPDVILDYRSFPDTQKVTWSIPYLQSPSRIILKTWFRFDARPCLVYCGCAA